jgi:hypothetical protein
VKRLPVCLTLLLVLGLAATGCKGRIPSFRPPGGAFKPPSGPFKPPLPERPPIPPLPREAKVPIPRPVRVPIPPLPERPPIPPLPREAKVPPPGAPKALESAGLTPQARALRRILESHLLETESVLLAGSKLKAGDLPKDLVEHLPEPLWVQAKCVRGLQDIGIELSKPGDLADPKVLTRALKDVHAADPKLAAKVKDAAAVAAEQKRQLQLAGQLRDIKLVEAVPPAGPPIPRRVADLPSPLAPGTSQAGQQESLLKGLEDLGPEVHAEARAAEQKLNRNLERWADVRSTMGHSYYHLYRLASNHSGKRDDPQEAERQQQRKQFLLRAEGRLGRTLQVSERLLVADMIARGYKDEQIVAELRGLDREEGQR